MISELRSYGGVFDGRCHGVCVLTDGVAAHDHKVPMSRCVGFLCSADVLESSGCVPRRRRLAQAQVRNVGRDLAPRRRRRRQLGLANPPRIFVVISPVTAQTREAHETRANQGHGACLRRAIAQLLSRERGARQHRYVARAGSAVVD